MSTTKEFSSAKFDVPVNNRKDQISVKTQIGSFTLKWENPMLCGCFYGTTYNKRKSFLNVMFLNFKMGIFLLSKSVPSGTFQLEFIQYDVVPSSSFLKLPLDHSRVTHISNCRLYTKLKNLFRNKTYWIKKFKIYDVFGCELQKGFFS